MFRVVALAACCALATSAAPPAAVVVQLDLDHALSGGPPQTNRWHAYATLGDFRDYQISSPSGTITGTGSSAGKNITGFGPFATYDALETETAGSGKWRLTLPGATPAQTSVYDLSFDFSSFGESNVGVSNVLFPTANATSSGPQHTFTWTKPTVTPKQLFVSLQRWDVPNGFYQTESYFGSSAPTSWTVPNLAEGLYQFRLEFNSMTQSIPMTATLLSGPDAGPFSANISWRQQSGTFFTVVPEPAISGVLQVACCSPVYAGGANGKCGRPSAIIRRMSEVLQRGPCEPLVPPGEVELLARDMTATFSADCTLTFAQEKLAEIGQWLPVDGDPSATLRVLIEQNSTGPLRLGFGGWRDLLLGAQFTNGNGELITAGGRTVKNVAGYDLTKFMVGGHGIFGRLATFTTRTHRLPDGALLVRHAPDPAKLASLLPTPLRPQWSSLTRDALYCGYLADELTLAWYANNARGSESAQVERRSVGDDINHRASIWTIGANRVSFRASVPPARLKEFVDTLGGWAWTADPAFGIVVGSITDDPHRASLRDAATSLGGSVRFGSSAADPDVSTNPAERQIIERLKAAFDPGNRLEPLPWQRRH